MTVAIRDLDGSGIFSPSASRSSMHKSSVLVGCNVGACEKGRYKLKALADYFGVPVEALKERPMVIVQKKRVVNAR